jgi:hypothetical protein
LPVVKNIAGRLAKTKFAAKAIAEKADLSALGGKPPGRVWLGMALVVAGNLLGAPAIALCAFCAYYWDEPMIIMVGGPVLLVVAHLIFLTGIYVAGGRYAMVLFRWLTRVVLEKLM